MEDVDVVAVCDKRPEQLVAKDVTINISTGAKAFDITKCRTYTDFGTMLRKEKLDVLVTALPTDLHAKIAIKAMNNGISVFTEKPMALTSKQCTSMIAARDKNGVQFMVGQCLRFWPEYVALYNAIRDKTYGKLESLTMPRIAGYPSWSADSWFMNHERSGAAILDMSLHDVDFAIHSLGKPTALTAGGFIGRTGGIDDVAAIWDYDGCMVSIRCSWKAQAFAMSFQAFFETASMDFGMAPDPALRLRRAGATEDEKVQVESVTGYVRELQYFLDCVRGRHPNTVCSAESTRDSIAMIELERKAIKTHRWVKVG